MATAVEQFTEEDPSRPLRTAEGWDPTQQRESAGPFLGDYNVDVTGQGQPQTALAIPPLPPMQRFAAPAAPPSVPAPAPYAGPAEVPGEAGPPAEEGPPGLVSGANEAMRLIGESEARRNAALQAQQAYQDEKMAEAQARLARSQAAYGAEGQAVVDLMERQAAARPAPPRAPAEPAVPKQRIRLFGEGPENQTGTQALQSIVMNLGLLAQMGMGLKSGYTRGAAAAYAGAINGWAEGNLIAGQQQWKEYVANVQKLQREWQRDRQSFDDILKLEGHDLERAKLKLAVKQGELGYDKSFIELTLKDLQQRWNAFKIQDDVLADTTKHTLTAMNEMVKHAETQRIHTATIENQLAQRRMDDMRLQLDKIRAAQTEAYQTAQLAGQAEGRKLGWAELASLDAYRKAQLAKERGGGVQAREAEQAYQLSKDAVNGLAAIHNDPKQKAVVDKWLGPTGPLWKMTAENIGGVVPGFRQLPPEVVAVNQYIAGLTLHSRKLLSGRAVTQYEGKPLLDYLPTIKDNPDIFWQKAAMSEANVDRLEKAPARDPNQPMTWDPMTAPVGGAAKIPAGPRTTGSFLTPPNLSASQHKGKFWKVDDNTGFQSDGTTWILQRRQAQ